LRYRARVEYDGTAYFGFQRQRDDQPTIQGKLETALERLCGQKATVLGAGRTDSGVHAWGQVIAFDLEWRHDEDTLLRAMNAHLPPDIALQSVEVAAATFHPRYAAQQRTYEYVILNGPYRSALRRQRAWQVNWPLDRERMDDAAALLIGTHDFATFGQPPKGDNTIRHVYQAQWQQREDELIFTISANAFLYRMVRSLVGTLVEVGSGKWSVTQFQEAFQRAQRNEAGTTAPAHGLFLLSVTY
jgi:tRNA pseudouridine38-40 synthase